MAAAGGAGGVRYKDMPTEVPPPTAEVTAASAFLESLRQYYERADMASIATLYAEDSGLVVDGTAVGGMEGVGGTLAGRFSTGPVHVRWNTVDALMAGDTTLPHLLVLATGPSSVPRSNFCTVMGLCPASNAAGMYLKMELLRFGGGAAPISDLDSTGTGSAFARAYYDAYKTDRMSLGPYYREGKSKVIFESTTASSLAEIAALLGRMPAGSHALETLDVVPFGDAFLLILVTGKITLEGETNALGFAQTWELANDEAGTYIANEMWRFVLE